MNGIGGPSEGHRGVEEDESQSGAPEHQHFAEMDPSGRFGRYDRVLGRGAFKVVYKAFDNQEGMEVAWNQVRVSELMPSNGDGRDERDRLMAEIKMLKSLKHKNIMTFYTYWWDPKTYTVNFITELFTSGTLRQYRKRHRKGLDPEVQKRWAWQILCGLVYLHGHTPPIIHRDLKCDNIFINGSDGTVKIGDLGLATLLRSQTAPQSVLGTPEFMAPELYEETYDAKVDVYSFGMCLLELDIMEYPYAECKNAAQIYRKVSLGIRPKGLQDIKSKQLQELINLCIAPYDERPESRQLLKHPYFDSIRPARVAASASTAALVAAQGGSMDVLSDYGGSVTSGGVSRTVSSMADGAMAHGLPANLSRDSAGLPSIGAPLSRTISGLTHADQHSDAGSLRSQRSNASELAAAVMAAASEAGMGELATASAAASAAALASGAPPSPFNGSCPPSAPSSKPPSPPLLSPCGSPKVASPTGSEGTRCEATNRCFLVVGKYQEDRDKFQLRLRICEPDGSSRTVEFEFDLSHDTAVSVAGEMVEDLQLSAEDAAAIASAIKAEVESLASQLQGGVSMQLEIAAAALQQGLRENAGSQAAEGDGRKSSMTTLQQLPAASLVSARTHGSSVSLASSVGSGPASLASAPASAPPSGGDVPPLLPPRVLSPPPLPPSGLGHQFGGNSSLPPQPASASLDFPAPSLSMLRSSSVDASAFSRGETFSRSSSAVQARDMMLQSPAHAGSGSLSGAVTPPGGILSPVASHDRRIPLNKLFENLEEVAAAQESETAEEGTAPPVPAPAPAAPLPPSSVNVPAAIGAGATGIPSLTRTSAPMPTAFVHSISSSSLSPRSHGSFPGGSNNLADAVARLELQQPLQQKPPSPPLQQQVHLQPAQQPPMPGFPSLAKVSFGRLASRDPSPGREPGTALSPPRTASAPTANGIAPAAAAGLATASGTCPEAGRRPPGKDKEALRKQAADAMKAVELRSLNLLEGGLLAGKVARGTPMAACRLGTCAGVAGPSGTAGLGAAGGLGPAASAPNLAGMAGMGGHMGVPMGAAAPGAAPGVMPGAAPGMMQQQQPAPTMATHLQPSSAPTIGAPTHRTGAPAAAAAAALAPAAAAPQTTPAVMVAPISGPPAPGQA